MLHPWHRNKCHVGAINFILRLFYCTTSNNYLIYIRRFMTLYMRHMKFIYLEVNRIKGLFNFTLFYFTYEIRKGGQTMRQYNIENYFYVINTYYQQCCCIVNLNKSFQRKKITQNIYLVYNYWLTYDMLCPLESTDRITFSSITDFSSLSSNYTVLMIYV